MSVSIRISPQASKIIAIESRSTGSDVTVIHMRLKKSHHARKSSFYTAYSSKVLPLRHDIADEPCVIDIIHDTGGAKAPWLICEGTTSGP